MGKYTPAVETGLDRMREMARGSFDLRWMHSNPEGWGHQATPGPTGLRLTDIESGHYCTAVVMRSSMRRCERMIARAGLVHSNGVGFRFHARM